MPEPNSAEVGTRKSEKPHGVQDPKPEDRGSKIEDRVPKNPKSKIGPEDCKCVSPSAFYANEDELEAALSKDPHVQKARAAQKKSAIPNPKSEIK